ncbi:glycosyltransferase family 4 protein [Bordetella genomosp. 12]|uniref:Glycosyltransferase family 1 protein n=1 Tax=Bordetella genomosp. 12 TaxID=463035 RepID=A0A261VDY9_9BORD|nr:glycosyltransferase family 4 protein [Bordetella genomosp. 12]OZI72319.1 glycosyltransferase family 1 protein [Bordetella genomosp. 12]
MSISPLLPSLRILHAEAATGLGGQERRILKEMAAMRERGHHLELICQPQAQMAAKAAELGFTVHHLPMGGMGNLLRGLPQIRRILKEGRFDVLNTHSRIDTLLAGTGARLARTPLVVRTRHLSNRVNSMLAYTWVPHRISTVSNHVRDYLIERGVPSARVETIYSPIKLPPADLQSTLRTELGLSPQDIVICSVAVLRATKGHPELIEALHPLIKADARVHLVIVGNGSPMFETLQTQIRERGLQGRIHMLGFRDDVPNIMAGSDIFALPTRKEASGTVFVEAAACGLPVVGLDVGGVSEMLHDGETGMLVPPDDITALRAALQRLIDEPQLRLSMGQAGKQRVRGEDKFSLRRLAERTESVYRRWLNEVAPTRFASAKHQTQ